MNKQLLACSRLSHKILASQANSVQRRRRRPTKSSSVDCERPAAYLQLALGAVLGKLAVKGIDG